MSKNLHELYPRFPKEFPLPMVLDGSTGTSLMREGMPVGSSTEKWVLANPKALEKIQNKYIESGSDALYAPTFGANRPTLERGGLSDTDKINTELAALTAGTISRQPNPCLCGGDMSPTGLFIEPFGDTPFDEVVSVYREQASALERAGVDFFVTETNISLQEARAAALGIREVSEKPIFVTMTVDENGRTLSGDSLLSCLLSLAELDIAGFGTNCSQGPDGMIALLKPLVPYSLALGIPLIAKPNAGLPRDDGNSVHFDLDAKTFAKYIPEFLTAGIPILGGCCGTDAGFIKEIRSAADKLSPTLDYGSLPDETITAGIGNYACTNRIAAVIDAKFLPEPIKADENFSDAAFMAEGEFIYVSLPDENSAETFLETAPLLSIPIAVTGNSSAIAKAKRYYNGRLFVKM